MSTHVVVNTVTYVDERDSSGFSSELVRLMVDRVEHADTDRVVFDLSQPILVSANGQKRTVVFGEDFALFARVVRRLEGALSDSYRVSVQDVMRKVTVSRV